jgi:hypothetical protein
MTKTRAIQFLHSHGQLVEDQGNHLRVWDVVLHPDTNTSWWEMQEFWPADGREYDKREIRDFLGY